jgi:hypothetical protein
VSTKHYGPANAAAQLLLERLRSAVLASKARRVSALDTRGKPVITVEGYSSDQLPVAGVGPAAPVTRALRGQPLTDQAIEDLYWILTHSLGSDLGAKLEVLRRHLRRRGFSESVIDTRVSKVRPVLIAAVRVAVSKPPDRGS